MTGNWTRLGEIMVRYSANVQPGERVLISMGETESFELVKALYEATIKAGGFPQVLFLSETLRRSLLKHGSDQQIAWVPELEAAGMEWADVYFGLRGAANLSELWDIPADRLALNQKALGEISTLRWKRTRWCLIKLPNAGFAREAGIDEGTMREMFFDACLLDWAAEGARWQRWADRLEAGQEIHVVAPGTDLRFSVAGRKWVVCAGQINMPDGEIATAPVTATVNGHIRFEEPGVLSGRLIDNIRLRWEHGELVERSSTSNEDFFRSVLDTDAGAKVIGEFAFGVNPKVTRFCKDILIDEKIGGTIHIALGRAYPNCGGTNESAIHWDIIKDLRKGGTVTLDGVPVLVNGEFRF